MDTHDYLTVGEVAALLRCKPAQVQRWCAAGRFKGAVRLTPPGSNGWKWGIPRAEALACVRRPVRAEELPPPRPVPAIDPVTEATLREAGLGAYLPAAGRADGPARKGD